MGKSRVRISRTHSASPEEPPKPPEPPSCGGCVSGDVRQLFQGAVVPLSPESFPKGRRQSSPHIPSSRSSEVSASPGAQRGREGAENGGIGPLGQIRVK